MGRLPFKYRPAVFKTAGRMKPWQSLPHQGCQVRNSSPPSTSTSKLSNRPAMKWSMIAPWPGTKAHRLPVSVAVEVRRGCQSREGFVGPKEGTECPVPSCSILAGSGLDSSPCLAFLVIWDPFRGCPHNKSPRLSALNSSKSLIREGNFTRQARFGTKLQN